MTTLLTAALRNPFIRTWSTRSTATIAGGRTLTSTDDLIGTLPLIGAKTGHTNDAGWSQVAAVQGAASASPHRVLGSPTEAQRNADLGALLAWGLAQYHPVKATDGRRTYGLAETGYGRAPIRLVARDGSSAPCAWASRSSSASSSSSALALPVARGQRVGEVRVFAGGRLIARTPLVAAESVSAVGTAGKARWYARRTVHHLVGLVS